MSDIWGQSGAPTWMDPTQRNYMLERMGSDLAQGFQRGFGMGFQKAGGSGLGSYMLHPRPGTVQKLEGAQGTPSASETAPEATGPEGDMIQPTPWDRTLDEFMALFNVK